LEPDQRKRRRREEGEGERARSVAVVVELSGLLSPMKKRFRYLEGTT
jgi:hypothetical protein